MRSNLTLSFPSTNKVNLDAVVKFPPPNDESYLVVARLDGGRNMDEIEYLVSYRTLNSGHKYGSTGNVSRFNGIRTPLLLISKSNFLIYADFVWECRA